MLREYKEFSPDLLLIDAHLNEFINIQQLLLEYVSPSFLLSFTSYLVFCPAYSRICSEISEAKFKLISYGARGGENEAQQILGKGISLRFFLFSSTTFLLITDRSEWFVFRYLVE